MNSILIEGHHILMLIHIGNNLSKGNHAEKVQVITRSSLCLEVSDMNKRLSAQLSKYTDSDVLALLFAHFNEIACIKLWLKSGTSAKPNYMCSYNLRDICHFPRGSEQHYTIPCDHWM